MTHYTDPSQNFILQHLRALDALFHPKTVAVIGAKDEQGTVGCTLMANLLGSSFGGRVFAVNPKRANVFGQLCYPSIAQIPEKIDLAIIVTPAATVPQLVADCQNAGVRSCIIISAGFKELGEKGLALEKEILMSSQNMPIIGPNCLGVMNPIYGVNATFAKGMALPGNVAFISQSGAMCTSVLDWSLRENVGFSAFVSIGSMADIDFGDLIDYLGRDPHTNSILIYMETIGDPRKFLSAAREIALEKPIIVIKAGRSQQAAKAAASHTGSMAGSDEIFDAALERVGVLRVDTIAELFQMASVLSRQPKPRGPRLSIVTNAGGPGVLATDAAIMHGATLAQLQPQIINELNQVLPSAWSHSNPIDILGDATPDRFAKTLQILAEDKESDGVLVILSPQDMTDPTKTAEALAPYAKLDGKPLLASWMGGDSVQSGIEILNQAQIPTFEYPDQAAATFATMWRYSQNIRALYQMPQVEAEQLPAALAAQALIAAETNTLIDEYNSKKILEYYGIPVVHTELAATAEEAIAVSEKIGFPCVLKLFSKTITHKTDVGGVKLNLKDASAVQQAFQEIKEAVASHDFQGVTVQKMVKLDGYELILGSTVDVQFGPTLLFGAGGQLVEVFKDRALGLPPLNRTLARFLIEKTKIYEALKGVRGRKSIDINELENILVRFSQLITENPRIKECDINPLLASPEGFIALDARIVLHPITDHDLPKLAIRPYPAQYISKTELKDGSAVLIRPIKPEDESLLIEFHRELSEQSVRQRYFEFMALDKRIAHERLMRICFNDFDREIALVAQQENKIIGVIRVTRILSTSDAQLTMIIRDAYHNLGLGTKLLHEAIEVAKKEKIEHIFAYILDENLGMLKICKQAGFEISPEKERILKAQLKV